MSPVLAALGGGALALVVVSLVLRGRGWTFELYASWRRRRDEED